MSIKKGRPPYIPPEKKRVQVALTLPPYIAQWLRAQPEYATSLIEKALLAQYNIKRYD